MDLKKQNILFFLRATQHGGTENVVVQLCEILKPYVNKIVVCSADGFKTKELNELGITFYEIPDIEKKNWKTIYKVLDIMEYVIKKEHITVIHSHHRMAAFYSCVLNLKYNFVRINTSHNTFTNKKFLTRAVYKKANLIACGEAVKKNLVEFYGFSDKRVTVIHNAVREFDGKIEEINELKEARDNGYFLIGNVGRLSEQKGMPYFIDAVELVIKVYPETRFYIIGDGEDRKALEDQVNRKGLQNEVFFLGYKNNIQSVISQLDFIVLSSLWEGLPLTAIEAYSVGKIVIGTAVDGTVEIIRDGVDGFLVEPKNPEAIAEKIICLIKNSEVKEKMEKAARIRYKEKFSFEKLTKSYIKYYESL